MIKFWMSRFDGIYDNNFYIFGIGFIYDCLREIDPHIEFNATKIINMNLLIEGFKI